LSEEIEDFDRIRLQRNTPSLEAISRQELLDLYKMLIDEYRFQVKLNSDRTQIYLVLNAAILTAGTGLLKLGLPNTLTAIVIAAIFLVGSRVAQIAVRAVKQGHEYYRAIVYKKTLVEDLLGRHRQIDGYSYEGATLALETTTGMSNEREILDDAQAWLTRPMRRQTITGGVTRVFWMFAAIDVVAALLTVASTIIEFRRVW
jgi:hypothetical protein